MSFSINMESCSFQRIVCDIKLLIKYYLYNYGNITMACRYSKLVYAS